ncbi:MAG: hypothetical protein ACSHWU_11760 [Marinicella sp.]
MNKIAVIIVLSILSIQSLHARTDLLTFDFIEVVNQGYKDGILDENIQFHLSGSSTTNIIKNHGEFRSNKKTNAVSKSDEKACKWVLLSVLKSFQSRAKSLGANAVINLKSNFKNRVFIDSNKFQCGAGIVLAGVAMIGEVVEL